jgi:hypothetical protein
MDIDSCVWAVYAYEADLSLAQYGKGVLSHAVWPEIRLPHAVSWVVSVGSQKPALVCPDEELRSGRLDGAGRYLKGWGGKWDGGPL